MTSNPPQAETPGPTIIQWLVDTRPLWPVPKMASPRDEVGELRSVASRALSYLSSSEQASVLRYYHLKDAKMSLASQLLKHLVIAKHCRVPWSQSILSKDANGKPYWHPAEQDPDGEIRVGFNVSHQAGLVSLIAVIGGEIEVEVGTDIVSANERLDHDYRYIEKDGFFSWIDIYADVFAKSEVNYMKIAPVELDIGNGLRISDSGKDSLGRCQRRNTRLEIKAVELEGNETTVVIGSNRVIDAKLRRFYAMWCLREAYVKMTGEALLAPWLGELEILDIQVPAGKDGTQEPSSLEQGQVIKDFRIGFKGKPVTNVKMELTALGTDYMVAAAARIAAGQDLSSLRMGTWKLLDLESDILAYGEAMRQTAN